MKIRNFALLLVTLCLLGLPKNSFAAIYNFVPSPSDLFDLDHYKYYTWGMNLTLQPKEVIVSANLFIDNINNWTVENDILYLHLLDSAAVGVTEFTDDQGGGDNFLSGFSPNIFLTSYTDTADLPGPSEDFSYNFTSGQLTTLNSYVKNNNQFGLGFDPDCHYFNDGVKLKVKTALIPEPATMTLMTSGLLGMFGLRRRKISKV